MGQGPSANNHTSTNIQHSKNVEGNLVPERYGYKNSSNREFVLGSSSPPREVLGEADDHRAAISGCFQDHLVAERGLKDPA